MILEWQPNIGFCPKFKYHSPNDEKYASIGTTDEISSLFPDFDNKLQNSLTCNKIHWLFPGSEKDWNFPDFPLILTTLWCQFLR